MFWTQGKGPARLGTRQGLSIENEWYYWFKLWPLTPTLWQVLSLAYLTKGCLKLPFPFSVYILYTASPFPSYLICNFSLLLLILYIFLHFSILHLWIFQLDQGSSNILHIGLLFVRKTVIFSVNVRTIYV